MYNWNVPELIQKNLTIAISRAGIKQRKLAKDLCVSEMTVSNWMCGRTTPSLDVMASICKYLNIPISALFAENDLPDQKDEETRNADVVFFQELNYVFLDKKRGFSTQYSLRTWPVPSHLLAGHPTDEFRLLHLFGNHFEPHFKEDDRFLIHCQGKAQDGDVLYIIKNNGEPTIRQMSIDDEGASFLPFDSEEQVFHVTMDKLDNLNIYGRVVHLIRPLSTLNKPLVPDAEETVKTAEEQETL